MPSAKKVRYWKQSLLRGTRDAKDIYYKLGLAYENGVGVSTNKYAAEFLYKRGISAGCSKSMVAFGDMIFSKSRKRAIVAYNNAWNTDQNAQSGFRLASINEDISYISYMISDKLCDIESILSWMVSIGYDLLIHIMSENDMNKFMMKSEFHGNIALRFMDGCFEKYGCGDVINRIYRVLSRALETSYKTETKFNYDMILDLFLKIDLDMVSCNVSYAMKLLHGVLSENVKIMDLHMKYAPGGDGFLSAKHDFFEKIIK